MNRDRWTILCLAYIIGLLSTSAFDYPNPHPSWQQWTIAIAGLVLLTFIAALFLPRWWRECPRGKFWLAAALVTILGAVYLQLRTPQPSHDDISGLLNGRSQPATVSGIVLSETRLTANANRYKIWLNVQFFETQGKKTKVSGKLYVTLPKKIENQLYPNQIAIIRGILYQPRSPANPGAFNFKAYLAKEGAFAGLKGGEISYKTKEPVFGWWMLRRRVVEVFKRGLGDSEGLLVSSMVLGQKAVDLPPNLRNLFVKTGLAHVLAASGFQVSLLLGVVLRLTCYRPPKQQITIGISVLIFYGGLTGLQPSILRAILMGIGVLIGIACQRKIRPLGALLLVGTLLLLVNPQWIWDLGFQLSFLATFGLVATMPAFTQRLDWLPSILADAIALPSAASLWTLPLLIYVFYGFCFYVIPNNILLSPLLFLISLGGMASAAVALILPEVGSAIVSLLYLPTHILIKIVEFLANLPLTSLAVGKISLSILVLIYSLMILIWLTQWWQRRWWWVGLAMVALVAMPAIYRNLTLVQVTVLAAKPDPVVVIQDRAKVTVINSGDAETVKYTLLPFLAHQGINQVNSLIAFDTKTLADGSNLNPYVRVLDTFSLEGNPSSSWQQLTEGKSLVLGSTRISVLNSQPPLLQLQIQNQHWLWASYAAKASFSQHLSVSPQVLLSSDKGAMRQFQPKVAIANASYVSSQTRQQLQRQGTQLYWTGTDGGVQWTPKTGFRVISAFDEPATL